jgi:hypothetical protein
MTIIDLNEFRQKKAVSVPIQKECAEVRHEPPLKKTAVRSDLDLITREAMRFKFMNMKPPGGFVTVHSERLPPSFPPFDDTPTPPMVA